MIASSTIGVIISSEPFLMMGFNCLVDEYTNEQLPFLNRNAPIFYATIYFTRHSNPSSPNTSSTALCTFSTTWLGFLYSLLKTASLCRNCWPAPFAGPSSGDDNPVHTSIDSIFFVIGIQSVTLRFVWLQKFFKFSFPLAVATVCKYWLHILAP